MKHAATMVVMLVMSIAVAYKARDAAAQARVSEIRQAQRHLPSRLRAPIAASLERAGVEMTPESAVSSWLIATVAAFLMALAIAPTLAVAVVPCSLLVAVCGTRVARARGDRRCAAALPDAVRSVVSDLGSGGTVASGINRLAISSSPLRADFKRIGARLAMGASVRQAVEPWPDERPISGVRAAAGGLVVTAELGGAAAGPLNGLADSLSARLAICAETRAQSAQARVSAIVVALIPLGFLAFSAAIDPDAIDALVARPLGRICLIVGIGLDGLAALWMRRIVRDRELSW